MILFQTVFLILVSRWVLLDRVVHIMLDLPYGLQLKKQNIAAAYRYILVMTYICATQLLSEYTAGASYIRCPPHTQDARPAWGHIKAVVRAIDTHTACEDEFRRNPQLTSQPAVVFQVYEHILLKSLNKYRVRCFATSGVRILLAETPLSLKQVPGLDLDPTQKPCLGRQAKLQPDGL